MNQNLKKYAYIETDLAKPFSYWIPLAYIILIYNININILILYNINPDTFLVKYADDSTIVCHSKDSNEL